MITIACVYRSGGDFTADDVAKLALSLKRFITDDYRICCLTDRPDEVRQFVDIVIPLKFNWPGWWAKMELFSLSGPVVYFDLDTWIIRPIDSLCRWVSAPMNSVIMLRDFYHGFPASGIMAWNRDLSWLTQRFAAFAENTRWSEQVHGIGCGVFRGDQDFIREQLRQAQIPVVIAQDIQSGIYSFKVHVRPEGNIPSDAVMICFHGRPRPHEVNVGALC